MANIDRKFFGPGQRFALNAETLPILRAGRNVARIGVLVGSVLSLGLVNSSPAIYLMAIGLTALAIPAIFVLEPARSNFRLWTIYLVSFVLFAHLRGFADDTFIPVRIQYVIDLEAILFAGIIPTEWLQMHLYTGQKGMLEFLLIGVHLSYFLAPHAFALLIWQQAPRLLARYTATAVLIFFFGLILYFLVPTAPPWYASEQGYLTHTVRIISDLGEWESYESYSRVYGMVGDPNPVAAMPSLHTALTVLVALGLARWRRRLNWLGWAYVAAMTVALVYLGEHYVVDIIAGVGIAVLAWRLSHRFDPDRPNHHLIPGDG